MNAATDTLDRLILSSVEAANRAVALLNDHPALQPLGVGFCAPNDPSYAPILDKLFSSREIISRIDVCARRRARPPRAPWMDKLLDFRGYSAPWLAKLPYPDEVYDYCSAIGPVFKVSVRRPPRSGDSDWQAVVQFFDVNDAQELQRRVNASDHFFGWTV